MMGPRNHIRFLLDGVVHTTGDIEPTTTLLNYLRERLRRTGTKEGCAEGDCGACTVVQVSIEGDNVCCRSVNSCIQFLPTIDGKAIFTVESLTHASIDTLHPIQRALIDTHSSQCGFCTPGFVMSLFALYKGNPKPGLADIKYALSGNLCRCTGYRSIIDAAKKMYEYGLEQAEGPRSWMTFPYTDNTDDNQPALETEIATSLRKIQPVETVELNGNCKYYAPHDLDALVQLLQQHPEATILAGGTDIGLWVTKQYKELSELIYIGNVNALRQCATTGEYLEIGAAVTLTEAFAMLEEHYPDLHETVRRFGSPPICNAGTLGGNIANGSPLGDSMPALIVLQASLLLHLGDETRELPLDEFYTGYRQTALREGEFVRAIRVPLPRANHHFRAYKIAKRFDQDISALCGAFWLHLENGFIKDVRICYGGMAETPKRALKCEQKLKNYPFNTTVINSAAATLSQDYTPLTDVRASRSYRQHVAANLLSRFYYDVCGEENLSVWRYTG